MAPRGRKRRSDEDQKKLENELGPALQKEKEKARKDWRGQWQQEAQQAPAKRQNRGQNRRPSLAKTLAPAPPVQAPIQAAVAAAEAAAATIQAQAQAQVQPPAQAQSTPEWSTAQGSQNSVAPPSRWTDIRGPGERHNLQKKLKGKCHDTATLLGAQYNTTGPSSFRADGGFNGLNQRAVVALDCEFAELDIKKDGEGKGQTETAHGDLQPYPDNAIVQVVAVDVLTGQLLLNLGVQYEASVKDWRENKGGMLPSTFETLKTQGLVVNGLRAVQNALRRFIEEDTIPVGQALNNDLKYLRMSHQKIVDTGLLTRAAVRDVKKRLGKPYYFDRTWGLRRLCWDLCGQAIQTEQSHDCVEDTYGAREVAIKCVLDPEALETWAVRVEPEVRDKVNQFDDGSV